MQALWVYRQLAFVALYEGNHDEAASWLERSLEPPGRRACRRRSGRT